MHGLEAAGAAPVIVLTTTVVVGLAAYAAALRLLFPGTWKSLLHVARRILGRPSPEARDERPLGETHATCPQVPQDDASMTTPPVTIGLPVYNGERFLPNALASIRGQTFADFRLVVSDNASTDRTVDIVEEHAAQDERKSFSCVATSIVAPHGITTECSVNARAHTSSGRLPTMCLLRRLSSGCTRCSRHRHPVVLAYPYTRFIDADGVPTGEYVDELASPPGATPQARLRRVLTKMQYGNVAFSLMRTEALRRTRQHGSFPSPITCCSRSSRLRASSASSPNRSSCDGCTKGSPYVRIRRRHR